MNSQTALRVVLIVIGFLFIAAIIPLLMFFSREPAVAMIMSLYVPLGICLLLAARDPAANRTLLSYAGWANVAHAGVMAMQEYRHVIARSEVAGVVVFGLIGVVLLLLTPAKAGSNQVSAASA